MTVTIADLKDQTCQPGPHPILKCFCCGAEYSSNKSDYFWMPVDEPFGCCNEPLELVVKRITYERSNESPL